MGLIAREIESQGIPTLSLSSAYSITRSVNPPRAVFLDFPLGHTAGRAHDGAMQDEIVEAALQAFETLESPGQIVQAAIHWDDADEWKEALEGAGNAGDAPAEADDRTARSMAPQYQSEADRIAAESLGSAGDREL